MRAFPSKPSPLALERAAFALVLIGALALRAWGLERNGWGAEYYSAAARSMAAGWHNFLFAAFDPQGFISVDKPPVALWIQAASVRIFGWHPASVLLPQAFEGAACVALLHAIVRPRFGPAPALLAALALALMPVLVAVNRTNNTDSALVLALLLAAWAGLRAAQRASRAWWLLSMALMGIAFNVKMLAAFVPLPAFFILHAACAPASVARRAVDLALGAAVVVAVAASWSMYVEATPAAERPWVGGSPRNSVLELIVGHNAASRFARPGTDARPGDTAGARAASGPAQNETDAATAARRVLPHAAPGFGRLLSGQFAAQVMWLLPFALVGAVLGFGREAVRAPPSPRRAFVLFWSAWTLIGAAVYSFAGGIIHFYYVATLAPPLAALGAVGVVESWRRWREREDNSHVLVLALLAAAAWELHVQASALPAADRGTPALLLAIVLAMLAPCAAALALWRRRPAAGGAASAGAATVAVAALLVLPAAWSLGAILAPAPGIAPSADLYRLEHAAAHDGAARRSARDMDVEPLVAYLRARRSGERFLLATTTTRIAAPIIVATGEPVMALGGFHGLDGAVTRDDLERRVGAREVRFVMLGDAAPSSRHLGADAALAPIAAWVAAHGRRIEGARWRGQGLPRGLALYDLRPREGP